nr:type ISP restriction/modification enzyme [Streptococcus equinus]
MTVGRGGVGGAPDDPEFNTNGDGTVIEEPFKPYQTELELEWEAVEGAIYGKIVQKVGDRRYLEDWSKDVADIARCHIQGIKIILEQNPDSKVAFERFLRSLQHNINESIDQEQAIEMLAQHLITQPIFEALFEGYSFVKDNPVSHAMNDVVNEFSKYGFDKEQKELVPFYESVKLRASGIDNAEAKQKIIVTLYDKFFRTGFKETTEQLGIVFTPVEVVDFIIKSVDYALNKYFGKRLASKNVHVLDPFTGTGTFITRTLQYLKDQMDRGEITFEDILHKYNHELHANEIVLLSYYIASINIEAVFDEVNGPERGYQPFEGIVLTDTFESTERENSFADELLGENNERLKKQQEQPITAIIGNPPYAVGQGKGNKSSSKIEYSNLNESINKTYGNNIKAKNKKLLRDSYIQAFRWATDRISQMGIIGFVTNGTFIDSSVAEGVRNCFYKEFNHLYIFNLRGNARTSGEQRRKEKDNVFGQGTRTPIAISILVKDGSDSHEIHYHDIGDYLSQKDKLKIIRDFGSVKNISWEEITPDENNDWINQRDPKYMEFSPMFSKEEESIFLTKNPGIKSHRDDWIYNFSKVSLIDRINLMKDNFNSEIDRLKGKPNKVKKINENESFLKWSDGLKKRLEQEKRLEVSENNITIGMIRPFTKKYLYYDSSFIEMARNFDDKMDSNSLTIYISGNANQQFSSLMLKGIPNIHTLSTGQGFLLRSNDLFSPMNPDSSNLNPEVLSKFSMSEEDMFYYIYGVLNDTQYKEKYSSDLSKDFPRIPLLKHKELYIEVGRKLAKIHLNYENISVFTGVKIKSTENPSYEVRKMKFIKKDDRSAIVYNDDITIENIPEKAYQYIINGKSAIEWIMDQYQIKTDKKSGITDDPNDYSNDEKYIFNLLLRIINVSIQTVDLINSLPKFEVEE